MTAADLAPLAITIGIIGVACVAGWTDWTTRRIPNPLTVGAFVLALVLRVPLGWEAVLSGLAGAGIAFALILPLFLLGGFGGGDAKLLVGMGAFLGLEALAPALAAIAIAGMAMAIIESMRRGVLLGTFASSFLMFKHIVLLPFTFLRPPVPVTARSTDAVRAEPITIPYGIAIGVGATFGHFYGTVL